MTNYVDIVEAPPNYQFPDGVAHIRCEATKNAEYFAASGKEKYARKLHSEQVEEQIARTMVSVFLKL